MCDLPGKPEGGLVEGGRCAAAAAMPLQQNLLACFQVRTITICSKVLQ
mgnify:CR=1 FL=1